MLALFASIAFSVQKATALVYSVVIVPVFVLVSADARLGAGSEVKHIPTVGVQVAIGKRQMFTKLHNFVISTHLVNVGAP